MACRQGYSGLRGSISGSKNVLPIENILLVLIVINRCLVFDYRNYSICLSYSSCSTHAYLFVVPWEIKRHFLNDLTELWVAVFFVTLNPRCFFRKFSFIFVMFISDIPSFFFKVISDSLLFYGKLLLLVIVICEMIFPSLYLGLGWSFHFILFNNSYDLSFLVMVVLVSNDLSYFDMFFLEWFFFLRHACLFWLGWLKELINRNLTHFFAPKYAFISYPSYFCHE